MLVSNVSELAQMRLHYYFWVTQKLKTDNRCWSGVKVTETSPHP